MAWSRHWNKSTPIDRNGCSCTTLVFLAHWAYGQGVNKAWKRFEERAVQQVLAVKSMTVNEHFESHNRRNAFQ